MCGIVGYIGDKPVAPVLLEGLKRLEYRGYDSAGIALLFQGKLKLFRSVGKLANLEKSLRHEPLEGNIGIGHTRWATHGKPSEENAHPHLDCQGRIVLVHNGIIENYLDLKKQLTAKGHAFRSETDTEVLVHLIEDYFHGDLLLATQKAIKKVTGSYALAVISLDNPNCLVAARKDSPLVLGVKGKESFVASDVPALLPHTKKVIYLDDGETALLKKEGLEVYAPDGRRKNKKVVTIKWNARQAEKGGFEHFMFKEIHEQPDVISDTLRGRLPNKNQFFLTNELGFSEGELRNIKKIFIVACGTSYHAGLVGKYLLEKYLQIPCEVDTASEFRYRDPLLGKKDLLLGISQSGETADTIAALREGKKKGARTLAICNAIGSTIARECDSTIYTRCGPEIGVASTKAFVGQLTAFYLLMLNWAKFLGKMDNRELYQIAVALRRIPAQIQQILKEQEEIQHIARKLFRKTNFLYLGRNLNYPIAMEGALKLKEISYIHAEGYPAGEMKHGPIALIDGQMPVLAIATESRVYEKVLSNIEEAQARGAIIFALATIGDRHLRQKSDYVFYLPKTLEILTPLLNVVPLQLFAYYVAVLCKRDVDKPRNLAKSVTVE
ncbi:MAG: glutamine--fructose-6-phosphate transaminase (isomerizing) [Elusimicrobiota bacterium]